MPDMKITMEERKDFSVQTAESKVPKYPHGLKLFITPEDAGKLGFQDPPKLGAKMKLEGRVEVTRVAIADEIDDSVSFNIELQITEMYLEKNEKKEEKTATKVLYGE